MNQDAIQQPAEFNESLADEFMEALGPDGLEREWAEKLAAIADYNNRVLTGGLDVSSMRQIAVYREMSRRVICAKHPKCELRIQWIAHGWADPSVESMRAVAKDYGLSPAAVSKSVKEYQTRFRLPENLFNKSEAACARYAQTNQPRKKAGRGISNIRQSK